MKLSMTYSVKIKRLNHIFMDTVRLYRQAVSFLWTYACRNGIPYLPGTARRNG